MRFLVERLKMKTVNFIIDDGNSYFAAGLRLCIAEYARDNNKTIRFLAPDSKEVPDVLFASSSRCIRHWGTPWHAATVAQSVIIEEEKGVFRKNGRRVLCRMDRRSDLSVLLDRVFADAHFAQAKSAQLTQRERQVVNYLRRGVDQSQTARLLGVSVKTVHSHKRSVMRKLMLSRNHEFIYWLLSQEGEYS